jgi:hypothetical protein
MIMLPPSRRPRTDLFKAMAGASGDGVEFLGHTKGIHMFTMMESLEGRQMFSVVSLESTALTVVGADPSATTQDAASPKIDQSSSQLLKACCTGKHIPTVVIIS